MPKGYWIVHVDVRDPEAYQKYVKANGAALAKYGARFLARGGKHVVLAGAARGATSWLSFATTRPPSRATIQRNIERQRKFATPRALRIS